MNVLSKLTARHLKLNKKRTIVSIIGIALATALIFAVSISVLSFQDVAIRAAIDTSGNFDSMFTSVAVENTKYIEQNSNIKTVMYSKTIGYSKAEIDAKASKQYIELTAYDASAFKNYPHQLNQGTLPANDSEVVISQTLIDKTGIQYKVGDTITLKVGARNEGGTLGATQTKKYTITGILDPSYTEKSYSDSFTALTFLDKNKLDSKDTLNVGVSFENLSTMQKTVSEIMDNAKPAKQSYNNGLLVYKGFTSSNNVNTFLYSIAAVVIMLIIIGSVAVIYNAFAISVNERKKQFGILASVGATSKQLKKMVYKESTLMAAIGIPLGLLIGYLGMFITFSIINSFNFLQTGNGGMTDANFYVIVSPIILAITVVLLIITIFISAYIPARKASKVTPLEAIRLTNEIKINRKKLRVSRLTNKIFGIEGVIALKNLKRNRKRYRTTIFSLFISIVLFISFSTIILYAFDLSDQQYGTNKYDFVLSEGKATPDEQLTILNKAVKLDGTGPHLTYRYIDAFNDSNMSSDYKTLSKIQNVSINILEMQDEDFAQYAKSIGTDVNAFSGSSVNGILVNKIVASNKFIEPLDVAVNSNLTAAAASTAGNTQNVDLKVKAITDQAPPMFEINKRQVYFIVTKSSMSNLLTALGSDKDGKNTTISPYYIFVKAENPEIYAKSLEGFQKTNTLGSFSYTDYNAMTKSLQQVKIFISIFLYGFITIITLIGVTNVFNTINTNIQLRRKEFAMLKSVGLTPKGFNRILNYESMFYGLKALLYGLPVGIGLSYLMYYIFGGVGAFEFILPWKAIIICIAAVFFIVYMTMLYAGSKIKKENIIDALVTDIN